MRYAFDPERLFDGHFVMGKLRVIAKRCTR